MEAPDETQTKDTKVNDAGKQPRRKGQKRKRPRKDDNKEDAEIMRKARKYDRMGKRDTNVRVQFTPSARLRYDPLTFARLISQYFHLSENRG